MEWQNEIFQSYASFRNIYRNTTFISADEDSRRTTRLDSALEDSGWKRRGEKCVKRSSVDSLGLFSTRLILSKVIW